MTLVLRYAARSDRGLVRANNEDSVYAGARLLALADGMGGHAAGEIASQLMIAALAPLDNDEPGGELLGKLGAAIRAGNETIADQVEESPELEGMGTTLTAILFGGSKLGLAHIGDSRAYLLRDDQLTQITRDDTFVQSLVDEGRITADQAHNHPQRSLIMRALTGNEIEPTLTVREARVGDRYLLCSDGLSDVVSFETIATTLSEGDQDQAADKLVALALRSGGPDNVTVIVADVIDVDYGQSRPIVAGAASHGDEEDYAPPNTAAGRAAAMRPPRAQPKVIPVTSKNAPPARKRKVPWLLLALTVVALLVVGAVVGRAVVRSSYYVAENDGQVAVLQGVPGSFLGYSLQELSLVGCVGADNEFKVLDADAPESEREGCAPLTLDDLSPSARAQVTNGLPSGNLDEVRRLFENLGGQLLPPCPAATDPDEEEGTAGAGATATAESPVGTTPTVAPTGEPTATPTGEPADEPGGTTTEAPTQETTPTMPPLPGQPCRTVA